MSREIFRFLQFSWNLLGLSLLEETMLLSPARLFLYGRSPTSAIMTFPPPRYLSDAQDLFYGHLSIWPEHACPFNWIWKLSPSPCSLHPSLLSRCLLQLVLLPWECGLKSRWHSQVWSGQESWSCCCDASFGKYTPHLHELDWGNPTAFSARMLPGHSC